MTSNKSSCLQQIISILREKREALATGRCRLTLTAEITKEICSVLYSSPRRHSTEAEGFLALLPYVKAIRVTQDVKSAETDLTINLSPFHHVTHLEVRNVQASRLSHLSKLRSQLNSLVIHSCVESLDEVLVECGGDKCQDSFLWSELQSLHVTSCPLLDLGTGLQLAPWLKIIDLSFNGLSDNGIQSLVTLLTLHCLKLNFNLLQKMPVLAPSARSSLKVLHLRQNQLESLKGLEQLSGLEELDVAYNCLSSSDSLSSLCSLSHMVKLCLENNPISYSKDYRIIVVRRVSTAVNKKRFELDGQTLNSLEKDAVGTMASLYSIQHIDLQHEIWSPPIRSAVQITVQEETVTQDVERVIASLEETTLNKSISASHHSPVNVNGGQQQEPSSTATPLTLSAVKRRRIREVEIAETDLHQPASISTPEAANPDYNNCVEHLTTKQRLEELRRTFGQDNWLHSQAGNQVRQLLGWQETEVIPVTEPEPVKVENKEVRVEDYIQQQKSDKEEEIVVLERDLPIETIKPCVLEEEVDVNVFLVIKPGVTEDTERLLTLSSTHVCEKDSLSGKTIASWKRSGFQSMTILEQTSTGVRLELNFRGIGQQQPVFIMEEHDYPEFENLLSVKKTESPIEPGIVDELSCMKCDRRFPSVRAAVKLRTIPGQVAKGQLEEYSACPYCGSDMVFTVDGTDSSAASSSSGSDVMVASVGGHRQHSPGSADSSTNESEEGSVEVVDKTAPSQAPLLFSTPTKKAASQLLGRKSFTLKSLGATPGSTQSTKSASSVSSHSSQSRHSSQNSRSTILVQQAIVPSFTYSYADFSQVDHRLRLYCEMFLLSHQTEEFHGLIKAEFVVRSLSNSADSEVVPLPVLLVVTSHKFYVLKITGNPSDQPEKWLNLETSYPLGQLGSIAPIIGYQGLVLHFSGATSLVLLRDQRRTKNVGHFLQGVLEKCGIVFPSLKTDLMTSQWLALEGMVRGDQQDDEGNGTGSKNGGSSQQLGVFLFCLVRVEWGGKQQQTASNYNNSALMVTSDRIALIRGDPRWLLDQEFQFRQYGVALISLQQTANLISVESFVNRPEQLRCYFLDEASNLEETWTVNLATREAVDQLIEAVRSPWEAMFSVELEVNEIDE